MDQSSKSSLKIVGVIALVAIVGSFGYSAMRKNSLEQSGRVIEQAQVSTESACDPTGAIYQNDSPSAGSECVIEMGGGCYDHEGVVSSNDQGVCCQDVDQGDSNVGCVPILDNTQDSSLKANKR
jgi:hypothetical protein